ncbi:hypothetical protein BJ944DRAFT_266985 [Cunninghamella echinulata]|nr:hypothetical protein BJ944DRAFT_266985 [Cunninghamella echinulata]
MILSSLLLVASSVALVYGEVPQPRHRQGCVVLQQKIHCFGGGVYVSGGNSFNRVLNEHYVLDLSKDFLLKDGRSAWQLLPPSNDFILEPNYSFGMTATSNTSFVVVSGSGYNDGKSFLKNKTISYDATQNTWSTIPSTINQTVGGTANYNGDNLYIFGGQQIYAYTLPLLSLYQLSLNNNQWTTAALLNGDTNGLYRALHASDIDSNGVIYYVGGRRAVPTGTSWNWLTQLVPFTSIATYDTKNQVWGSIKISGTVPSIRTLHTFTYMPQTNNFVMFGGKQGDSETPIAISDICYTYDVANKTWQQQNVAQIGSGSRYGHSAVLYKDLYLFIIFGADTSNFGLNDFHMLDVRTWSWLDNFSASGEPQVNTNDGSNPNGSNSSGSSKSNESSISSGAIAGIVVAVVALLGVGAGLFYLRKRKQNSGKDQRESRDQFVVDHEYEDPVAPPQYFSPTAVNFMANNNENQKSQQLYQQAQITNPQEQRSYIPDEMSTSTAPTYSSLATPITSDTQQYNQQPAVYKPDLMHDDRATISPVSTVKPFSKD